MSGRTGLKPWERGGVQGVSLLSATSMCMAAPAYGRGAGMMAELWKARWISALVGAATSLFVLPAGAHAQQVETPAATSFAVRADDDSGIMFALAEALPGSGGELRIGVAVRCERASGLLEALMSFGTVPADKPVQTAVRAPDGRVERFGPVEWGGGPAAGFFDPKMTDRDDVLRLVDAAFVPGALISNGHNSVWNRIGEDGNREAREALRRCAGIAE